MCFKGTRSIFEGCQHLIWKISSARLDPTEFLEGINSLFEGYAWCVLGVPAEWALVKLR